MSRRELKAFGQDSVGFVENLGRTRAERRPLPMDTSTLNSPSMQDVNLDRSGGESPLRHQLEETVESGRLLKNRVEELEGSFELAQVKLQLEHLKPVKASFWSS